MDVVESDNVHASDIQHQGWQDGLAGKSALLL